MRTQFGSISLTLEFAAVLAMLIAIPQFAVAAETFGNPAKAEFYPGQANPQSADGSFVEHKDSSEVSYVKPRKLLDGSDIASIQVRPAAAGSAVYGVFIRLNSVGVSKVRTLIAQNTPDAPVVLVWKSLVYARYSAYELDPGGGEIMVLTKLSLAAANSFATALR